MNWNMKKIGAYRKSAGIVMAIVMSFHIFSGLRLFCPGALLPPARSLGIDVGAFAGITPENDSGQIDAISGEVGPQSRGGTSKCNCQKQKKCPVIPRAAIASNPTQQFNDVQRQFKSVSTDSLFPRVADDLLGRTGDPPLMEQRFRVPFYCLIPLEITCALLI